MIIKFSVADRVTGKWAHFTHDVSLVVVTQLVASQKPMSFLQKSLSDDRFDGRAMIWEPAHGEV